jgi:hypothetical protein
MEHVEPAELVDCRSDRGLQTVGVGYVGTDRDCLVAREVSGFFAGSCVDLGNGNLCTFAGEQDCGGTANPATGAGNEGHLACEPWHRSLLLDRKFEKLLRWRFAISKLPALARVPDCQRP